MKFYIKSAVLFFLLSFISTNAKPLAPFSSCRGLFEYMTKNAIDRVGPYGLGNPIWLFRRGPFQIDTPGAIPLTAPETTSTSDSSPTEGTDFSGTNVQVEGVDEPDIIKTDGKRVFVLKGKEFYYAQSKSEGMDGEILANLSLPTFGQEMLLSGNYVVVISQTYENRPINVPGPDPLPLSRATISRQQSSSLISRPSFGTQVIVLYKLYIDKTSIKLIQTLRIPGRYISSRLVDNTIRLVSTYDGSSSIQFVYPNSKITNEEATKQNKMIIKNLKLSNWLPYYTSIGESCYYLVKNGVKRRYCRKYNISKPLSSCQNVFAPKNEFSGFSLLSVSTINLSHRRFVPRSTSIIADGDTVYSNTKSLYVATTEYEFDFGPLDRRFGSVFRSSFHKFSLQSTNVKYIASGEISGSVLNQFSMHEYNNVFFIATTDGAPWWGLRNTSSSKISAFKEYKNTLSRTSEVGGLGVGERIYAVRYIADKAYVVTFRQVDPLYIVDLSDVHKLKVTGILKIPGYSAYLHPIGKNKLLGVGREATPEGRTTGAKVSLFDISDITNPIEVDNWTLKGSYSSAEWDHRAFLYWEPAKIAVLPISVYSSIQKDRFFGSIILEIGGEISERGRTSHICCGNDWETNIQRNFVLGRTNLWSLSSNSLQVNAISDLKLKSSIPLVRSQKRNE